MPLDYILIFHLIIGSEHSGDALHKIYKLQTVFISFFSSFPYIFRAFMGPSSGVFQAVVFMLPFGSCSALLIVCVRQRTGLWW